MGDRISIQFVNGTSKSAVLFSHWDGMYLKEAAEKHIQKLVAENGYDSRVYPLDRLEPDTVMVDFMLSYITERPVKSNYYVVCSDDEGDNSDNGHFIIDLAKFA